jgi:WD40 repeat protein
MPLTMSCPGCGRTGRFPEAFQGKTVRCPECGTRFVVETNTKTDSDEWYYQELGEEKGPVSFSKLQNLACRDEIGPDTLVRQGPHDEWKTAVKIWGFLNTRNPAVEPGDGSSRTMKLSYNQETQSTFIKRVCGIAGVVAVIMVSVIIYLAKSRERAIEEGVANRSVEEMVNKVRENIIHHEWDQAIQTLKKALSTEYATNLGPAKQLLQELELASSDDKAIEYLSTSTDDTIYTLVNTNQRIMQFDYRQLEELHLRTLRRNLGKGMVQRDQRIIRGEMDGTVVIRDEQGFLREICRYRRGKKEGFCIEFEKGECGDYNKGLREGVWLGISKQSKELSAIELSMDYKAGEVNGLTISYKLRSKSIEPNTLIETRFSDGNPSFDGYLIMMPNTVREGRVNSALVEGLSNIQNVLGMTNDDKERATREGMWVKFSDNTIVEHNYGFPGPSRELDALLLNAKRHANEISNVVEKIESSVSLAKKRAGLINTAVSKAATSISSEGEAVISKQLMVPQEPLSKVQLEPIKSIQERHEEKQPRPAAITNQNPPSMDTVRPQTPPSVWDGLRPGNRDKIIVRKEEYSYESSSKPYTIKYSPHGTQFAVGDEDGFITIWDTKERSKLFLLGRHNSKVNCLDYSPDGKLLASTAVLDRRIILWSPNTGRGIGSIIRSAEELLTNLTFGKNRYSLAGGDDGETITIWNVRTGRPAHVLRHSRPACVVVFSPDGKTVATAGNSSEGSKDILIQLWNAETGARLCLMSGGSTDGYIGITFSPDGREIASCGSGDEQVHIWDATTGKEVDSLKTGEIGGFSDLEISKDGKWLALIRKDNTVEVRQTTNRKKALVLENHADTVTAIDFSPDSKFLASASLDGTVKIWRLSLDGSD